MVKGRPFSARTSRHRAIASLILSTASVLVLPWLTHPGMEGHSAIQTPSSSRSSVTLNLMVNLRTQMLAKLVRNANTHLRLGLPLHLSGADPQLAMSTHTSAP